MSRLDHVGGKLTGRKPRFIYATGGLKKDMNDAALQQPKQLTSVVESGSRQS